MAENPGVSRNSETRQLPPKNYLFTIHNTRTIRRTTDVNEREKNRT